MLRYLIPIIASLLAAASLVTLTVADDDRDDGGGGSGPSYSVGFWGDVPYSEVQRTSGVPNLIADMNRQRLAFSVHDGDIKSGSSRCDNEVYAQAERYFNSLRAPALYTPGDNEWTDCDRPSAGPTPRASGSTTSGATCSTVASRSASGESARSSRPRPTSRTGAGAKAA